MTDVYMESIMGYTKQVVAYNRYTDNRIGLPAIDKNMRFNILVAFQNLLKLSIDESNKLNKYGCSYALNMRQSIQVLMFKLASNKYTIFSDYLRKLSDYYFQSEVNNNGDSFCRLSKDSIEFMNMLNKGHVPFLDDVL